MLARFRTILNYATKAATETPAVMQEFTEAQPILNSKLNASSTNTSVPPASSTNLEVAVEQAKFVKQHCR